MFCPVCHAEYRQGAAVCADCHAALVSQLPSIPGESEDDPFCAFWSGDDPRVHAELCALLEGEGIPYKTLRREDHLFNIVSKPAFQIGVPYSLFEKAERAVKEAFSAGGEAADATESAETEARALPEPANFSDESAPKRSRSPDEWIPEDAIAQVWTGDDPAFADLFSASLRENQIQCRTEERDGKCRLYVLPFDESAAREILREIIEGAPPA
jgi:hypothetical protein